jgi:hypothetical protein
MMSRRSAAGAGIRSCQPGFQEQVKGDEKGEHKEASRRENEKDNGLVA